MRIQASPLACCPKHGSDPRCTDSKQYKTLQLLAALPLVNLLSIVRLPVEFVAQSV